VKTEQRYDDFGRKVVEVNPDRGMTVYKYDAGGRLLALVDESRSVIRYRYDHANRLVAAGAGKETDLVQYHYQGMRRSEIVTTVDGKREHATEIVGYAYDAFGQVTQETRWMARVDGTSAAGLTFVTHNTYDAAGRLTAQQMPDGHTLHWRYRDNGSGQLDAILFDDLPVVSGIQQTQAGGLTGYVNGNGIRQQISLDGRGRIHELQARGRQAPSTLWQRVLAWFGKPVDTGAATIYRQTNVYDAADRLTDISRQKADPAHPGSAYAARAEHYGYDGLDRLTQMPGTDGTTTTLRYDRGGNRISENTVAKGVSTASLDYRYAPGTNRLVAATQAPSTPKAIPTLADATSQAERVWVYHATGVPLAQIALMGQQVPMASNRVVYNDARRPIAVFNGRNELIARYHYNGVGERVAKTVFPAGSANGMVKVSLNAKQVGTTTYSLYANQRLTMETDADGNVRTHYVYLGSFPVAKIEMEPVGSAMRTAWNKLSGAASTQARVYAIHTDHLGAPQVVTDQSQHVVWQAETEAFGRAHVSFAAATNGARPFEMNLRLPGQVYDRETNLHYNYLRDYDPDLGRYTTPDPLGLAGGLSPYAYVNGNPLTNLDPLGLYSIEVHYYMTLFLAQAAGMDYETALTIAQATQYIDENPATWPMDDENPVQSNNPITSDAREKLQKYHFTTSSPKWWDTTIYDPPRTPEEKNYYDEHGKEAESYIKRRYEQPDNPQLRRLMNASNKAPTPCAKAQFFGEFLHAFEDTFAHRTQTNEPIKLNLNTGHLWWGHSPDVTYNHYVSSPEKWFFINEPGDWNQNEDRTLEMEKEVFEKLKDYANKNGAKAAVQPNENFSDLKVFLEAWNAEKNDYAKILMLNNQLMIGYGIDPMPAFNKDCAGAKRDAFIGGLKQNDYDGTILPTQAGTINNVNAKCH